MSSAQLSEHEVHPALPTPPAQRPGNAPGGLDEPNAPRGSSARKWIIVLVILAVVGAAVWKIRKNSQEQAAQSNKMAAAGDRPTPVMVSAVQQKTMPIYLMALGTVTASNTVTIKSRVDGQLLQVNVREGQSVKKGQPLLQIDPRPYEAIVAQAEGNLIRDQATANNAQAQAARYTALLQAGVVSRESQQAQTSTAGQAAGAIAADQAAIQAAKVNLAYTRISSPIDGVVGLRQVDPGNIVHASDSTGLLVVTQLQPIAVIFTLPEDHLPQVQSVMKGGRKLPVEAYDRSNTNHLATGVLLTLDNQIDTTTGTVKVKALFDNKDGALFPNQFVNIRLILQDRPNSIVIPVVALQTGSQGTFVYLLKQGQPPADTASTGGDAAVRRPKTSAGAGAGQGAANGPAYYVEARPVKVDLTEGTQVILESGVAPGDTIVIDGQEKLKNGAKVIPREAPAPTSARGTRGSSAAQSATPGAATPGAATSATPSETTTRRSADGGNAARPNANGGNPAGQEGTGQSGATGGTRP